MTNYDQGFEQNAANYEALTPISFEAHDFVSLLSSYQARRVDLDMREVYQRCGGIASALSQRGISKGDTVAMILPNIPEMFDTFCVPMSGGVFNAINTRQMPQLSLLYSIMQRLKSFY